MVFEGWLPRSVVTCCLLSNKADCPAGCLRAEWHASQLRMLGKRCTGTAADVSPQASTAACDSPSRPMCCSAADRGFNSCRAERVNRDHQLSTRHNQATCMQPLGQMASWLYGTPHHNHTQH